MSHTANKTAIGAFVVVAALLAFACVVFFGNISFSDKTAKVVIYVTDSVNGLDVGSAVKFKGVKIGSVSRIVSFLSEEKAEEISVPVILEIDNPPGTYTNEDLQAAIERGLRARLQMTSVVTGLLYVDLDFVPNSPAVFRGKGKPERLPEIPTIPSNANQMMKSVSTILEDLSTADFSELSEQLRRTVRNIDNGVSKIEFEKINGNVVRLTDSAAQILEDPELKKTARNINRLIDNIDVLSGEISGQIDPVSTDLRTGLAELRNTLAEIGKVIRGFQKSLSPQQGSLGQELNDALVQINDAARAVRALADALQVRVSPDDAGAIPPRNGQSRVPAPESAKKSK